SIKVPIEAVVGHIEPATYKPFSEGLFPLQNLSPRLEPNEFIFGLLAPEFFRGADGFIIQLAVLREGFDVSGFGKIFGRWENTLFMEDRRDAGGNLVFRHKNSVGCGGSHHFFASPYPRTNPMHWATSGTEFSQLCSYSIDILP